MLKDLTLGKAQVLQPVADVARQPRAMRVHITDRDEPACVRIGEFEPGKKLAQWLIPIDAACSDLPRYCGGSHRL